MESPKDHDWDDRASTEQQETCQCSEDLTACLLREAERAEAQLKRAVEAHEQRVQGMMAAVLQRMEEARWAFVAEFLSQRATQRRLRQRLQEEATPAPTAAPRHQPAAAQDVCPEWGLDQVEECVRKSRRCEHTPSNWDPEHPGPCNMCSFRRQGWTKVREDNHCMHCLNDGCVHFGDKPNSVNKGLVHLYNQHVQRDFDEIGEISAKDQDIYMKNRDSFCNICSFSNASTQTGDCEEDRDQSTRTLLFRRQHCSCKRCTETIKDQQRHNRCINKKNRSFPSDRPSEFTRKNDTSVAYGHPKQDRNNADQQCCTPRKECRAYTPRGETCGDRGDFCRCSSKDVNRRRHSDSTTRCARPFRVARRPDGFSKSLGELPNPRKGFGGQGIRFPRDSLSKRQWSKCSMSSSTSRKRRSRRKYVDSQALSVATTNIPPPSSRKVEATDSHRISRYLLPTEGAKGRVSPAGEAPPLRLQDDEQRRLVALIDARDALLAGVARDGDGDGRRSAADESLFAVAAVNAQIRRLLSPGDAHQRLPRTNKLTA